MRLTCVYALMFATMTALPALAHDGDVGGTSSTAETSTPWRSLSARYRVSYTPAGKAKAPPPQVWTLSRSPDQIALSKGPIEDIWWRDSHGQVGMHRVFRDDRFVVDYFPGELKTLGVELQWDALATLFDERSIRMLLPRGMAQLAGRGVYRFTGQLGQDKVDLHWDAAARLPARLTRQGPKGSVRYELLDMQAVAPASWPVPGAGIENFERVDAADFGDMDYNPMVRMAESFDVRAGWRAPHEH